MRGRASLLVVVVASMVTAASCKVHNDLYCGADCDGSAAVGGGGGTGGTDARDASDGPDGSDALAGCTGDDDCRNMPGKLVCDTSVPRGKCVQCTTASDTSATACTGASAFCGANGSCRGCANDPECAARSPTAPICDNNGPCRACHTDVECPAPGVCLENGACAATGDVVFVEYNATTCPGASTTADGSTTKPFCAPNDAVAKLLDGATVMVIRGPVNAQLALSAAGKTPVIVGKNNTAGDGGSIPAGASTGIAISGGDVLVRDLKITGGTAAASKGIQVTGTSTRVRLLRVTVSIGMGLGVEADQGTELDMDECIVQGNSQGTSAGGLLLNGATHDIANSVFAANGYGVQFTGATIARTSRFWFNTVVGNLGNAVTCDPNNMRALIGSIVVGQMPNCTLDHTVTTMPTLDASYHLSAHLTCAGGDPSSSPDHDLDGQSRAGSPDCGADQYVALSGGPSNF